MVRLSALVCVQNQEEQLSDCLRRLWFCDEIVVVADRCSDSSLEVARRHGAVVAAGIFPLECQRRQAGLEAASGDWILEVAPDERVDSALAWEIRATLKMGPEGDWFEIPLANHIGGERVGGGWTSPLGAEREVRLYRPGAKRWAARRSDRGEAVGAAAGGLRGELRRQAGAGLGELLERVNRLSGLAAEDIADAGAPPPIGRAVRIGVAAFLRSYLARRGWREGARGFVLAALCGLHPLLAHLKAREVLQSRALAAAKSEAGDTGQVVRLGVG